MCVFKEMKKFGCDGRFGAHDWVERFLLRGALGRPLSARLFGALIRTHGTHSHALAY